MGNNHVCQVEGIGIVSIKMFDGIVRHLKEVRHVPNLTKKLISLGILDDLGYTNKIEKGSMKISKGSLVAIKGVKRDGLYHLLSDTFIEK